MITRGKKCKETAQCLFSRMVCFLSFSVKTAAHCIREGINNLSNNQPFLTCQCYNIILQWILKGTLVGFWRPAYAVSEILIFCSGLKLATRLYRILSSINMECFVSYQHQKSRIRINQLKRSILVEPMVFIRFNYFFLPFINLKTPNTGKVMTGNTNFLIWFSSKVLWKKMDDLSHLPEGIMWMSAVCVSLD